MTSFAIFALTESFTLIACPLCFSGSPEEHHQLKVITNFFHLELLHVHCRKYTLFMIHFVSKATVTEKVSSPKIGVRTIKVQPATSGTFFWWCYLEIRSHCVTQADVQWPTQGSLKLETPGLKRSVCLH